MAYHQSRRLQDLLFSSPLEPVLMAIDFENLAAIRANFENNSNTQLGFSIFDTRKTIGIPFISHFSMLLFRLEECLTALEALLRSPETFLKKN